MGMPTWRIRNRNPISDVAVASNSSERIGVSQPPPPPRSSPPHRAASLHNMPEGLPEGMQNVSATLTSAFDAVYAKGVWGKRFGGGSGPGSTVHSAAALIELLVNVTQQYNMSSILDAACGSMAWMPNALSSIDSRRQQDGLGRIRYTGMDIVGALIKKHRAAFAKEAPFWRFVHANMSDASIVELGAYDLIIAREVFFHVPESFVLAALRNFQRTGSRWLMATHNPTFVKKSNNDSAVRPVHGYVLGEGGVRHLNLRLPPYNLPAPRLELTELVVRGRGYAPKDTGNRMAMWKLEELRL